MAFDSEFEMEMDFSFQEKKKKPLTLGYSLLVFIKHSFLPLAARHVTFSAFSGHFHVDEVRV